VKILRDQHKEAFTGQGPNRVREKREEKNIYYEIYLSSDSRDMFMVHGI